ncbi:hypothetical protein JL720_2559 [Aureococcus anophagefferens]|nr:hypothetical protein JL720_2559 [Aureococcus anophagefferens]
MDLDDDEQEQAAKAKRKLKRRSKKKSAKAKNAAGAAPHAPVSAPPAAPPPPEPSTTIAPAATQPKARLRMKDQEHIRRARLHEAVTQEQERNAFLERIQAEEVRREQARIAAARPVPPPPNRATAGGDSDEGWEESDEDDPVEDLIHRERIRERDLLRTPGCLALGRKAFRLEDMPRTERDREILRRVLYILREAERRLQRLFPNLDFRLSWSVRFNVVVQTVDAIALDSNLELTRIDMEVRRSTVGVYEDSLACQLLGQTYYVHPDKTIKITVDLVVTSEVIGASPATAAVRARSFSLAGTAPGRAEVQIKELGFHFIDPLAPIAEKEIVPRPVLDDGHLIVELKYLQAMHVKNRMLKKCCYTLYLLELADRLRAEASRETLKTARKNVVELDMALLARPTLAGVIRKFANAIARKAAEARGETFVPTPYDETAVDAVVVTAVPPAAPDATLVADGAKKVEFHYCKTGANGSDYLKARFRGLAETDPLRLEFEELARAVAAAADELPVDRLQRVPDPGLVNLPTIWPRMRFPSAATGRRATGFFQRPGMCYRVIRDAKRRNNGGHRPRAEDDQCPAYYGVDFEALRSLENAFSEFMPERFYGIDARPSCYHGKVAAIASIPGVARAGDGRILFGTYDSKVEVSIQEKHRISEVVVARIEEHNVERAEAEKPLPPLHVAGASRPAAKLYVVPNCEIVSPPPPPIYHVTENGERLVLYATLQRR